MADKRYTHEFIPSTGDSFWDDFFNNPMKILSPRQQNAELEYHKQIDNYNEMLEKGFENWPFETILGLDTLTWLSEDSLANVCEKRNGKQGDYTACTFHNEPPIKDFKNKELPTAGSHTYMSSLLPESIWKDVGNHEKDHHSATTAMQVLVHAAHQQNTPVHKIPSLNAYLQKEVKNLRDINDSTERTDWLQKNSLGKYLVQKRINHEPLIRNSLLNSLRGLDDYEEK